MPRFRPILHRLRGLFRWRSLETEMNEELRAHLDALIERNLAAGMPPTEARHAALRTFGGVEQIKERARDERRSAWVEQGWQDVRHAARTLRKNPSFTLTAVLTLALGIGVNAALFTVYDMIALRPLPVKDPDELVKIAARSGKRGTTHPNFTYLDFVAYRDGNRTLSGLAAVNEASLSLLREAGAERDPMFEGRGPGTVPVQWVSESYFDVLGAQMALGRGFLPEENRAPGAAPVVVLSHLFWQRYLHADPEVLGTTLLLGRQSYTIVGVATPEFAGQQPAPPAAWLPLTMWGRPDSYGPKGPPAFRLIGRLRPGVTERQAKADLDLIAARRAAEFSTDRDSVQLERGMRFVNIPFNARTLAAVIPLLLGFGLVLVIACTNVANLLLARGVTRQQEIGVRLTLGATRGRMLRQLLAENVLLCAVGAAVGLALAVWTLEFLQPVILGQVPAAWAAETRRWHFLKVVPDLRVAGFTLLLTLVASLAAGLLPALHAVGANVVASLKNDGTALGRRVSQSRLRSFLVVVQVAVCVSLLSCAGLLARNLFALRNLDPGFAPRAIFAVNLSPRSSPADRSLTLRMALEALQSIPGVAGACVVERAPLMGDNGMVTPVRASPSAASRGIVRDLRYCVVSAGFFETFGVPLVRGRTFTSAEMQAAARAVVVSEAAAHRLWPGEEPVGKTLAISEWTFAPAGRIPGARIAPDGTTTLHKSDWAALPEVFRECEVIGVARDITSRVADADHQQIYLPYSPDLTIVAPAFVRPRSDSSAALAEIVQAADAAGLNLQFNRRIAAYFHDDMLPYSGLAALSGALGGLALLMASVGLYGVMAFSVNQRVREIGIRVALGATAEKIVRLFVGQGMRLVASGLALGLGGGALFALMLAKILYGLGGAFDPVAFGAVTLIFAAIALFACWLPARRATKVDPMVALRAE